MALKSTIDCYQATHVCLWSRCIFLGVKRCSYWVMGVRGELRSYINQRIANVVLLRLGQSSPYKLFFFFKKKKKLTSWILKVNFVELSYILSPNFKMVLELIPNSFLVNCSLKGCVQSNITQRYGLNRDYIASTIITLQVDFVGLSQ